MPGILFYSCTKIRGRNFCCRIFLFLLLVLKIGPGPCSAQRLKIDSLKRELPRLHDSALADGLNVLSLAYSYLQTDSAFLYAEEAYKQAVSIHYLRGVVMSYNNKAHIEGVALLHFREQEKISTQTIGNYQGRTGGPEIVDAYLNQALAFFCQSDFGKSALSCREIIRRSKAGGDPKKLGEAYALMGSIGFETGNYDEAFDFFNRSLAVFTRISDSYNTAILLAKMGDLYRIAGDVSTASTFYFQSLKYPQGATLAWYPLADLGDTYYSLQAYDTTLHEQDGYLNSIKSLSVRTNMNGYSKLSRAEADLSSGRYDDATALLRPELGIAASNNDRNKMLRLLLDMARAHLGKKDFHEASRNLNELIRIARSVASRQYLRDGYQLMNELFDQTKQVDSAYLYFRSYSAMKDSIALDKFTRSMAILRAVTKGREQETEISLLNNEKKINEQQLAISQEQLKNELITRKILVGSILVLALVALITFRNIRLKQKNEAALREIAEKELKLQKLEAERTSMKWQQQANALEMQALRAQMNPHFIFNCLNSINRFTQSNEPEKAADYLTKFSKLIRMVLQQSGQAFITLEEELSALSLYLDLEAIRFEKPFTYEIHLDGINPSIVEVPPLLLQPFVENAIWHGLHPSEKTGGRIQIDLAMKDERLECSICDNGVGRNATATTNKPGPEKKSMGIHLTRHRIELFESFLKQNESAIFIEDLFNEAGEPAGTCVRLKIPTKSD